MLDQVADMSVPGVLLAADHCARVTYICRVQTEKMILQIAMLRLSCLCKVSIQRT